MTSPRPDADTSATGSEVSPDPTVRGDDSASRDASAGAAPSAASGCSECHKYAGHCPYCHSPRPLIAPTASPAARSMHPRETPETRPDVEGLVAALDHIEAMYGNTLPAWAGRRLKQIASALSAYEGRLQELTRERDEAARLMGQYAREAGDATGRLEMSEAAGMVDEWREHAKAAEARASAAEKAAEKAAEEAGKFFDRDFSIDGPNIIIEFKDHAEAIKRLIATRAALTALEQKPEGEG